IQCQVSAFELENIYKTAINSDSHYYIVDGSDNIVSSLDPNTIQTSLRLDASDKFIFNKPISETPWHLVGSYNYSNIKEEMKQISYQQIYAVIIIFLIVIGIAYVLSLRITASLRNMNAWLGMVGIDNMDVDFPPHMQIHEISELAYSFNEMVQRIESLIDELLLSTKKQVDLENKKKNAELIALQSQINPHFLYNTFDNINWLIKSDDKENSLQMVTALSNLLRYSSKSDRLIVTVAEEIRHIQSYMEIMKIRFSEQISLHLAIDESLLSYHMIKLTLQPIIENAIYHAIAPKQQGGRIKVKMREAPDKVIISVLDDGVGLTKEQAEQLNRNLNKEGYPERIGLYNVQTRIRLFFGNEYGLRIRSRPGKGTSVEIHLPKNSEIPNITNKF
ncbi:MAG: histidine kinase, partial [Paenibacillaceae bacterium]|nr:histidine kinase [Paenibacillaceae bacterium]